MNAIHSPRDQSTRHQPTRTQSLRNVGILAHVDAGKTTLAERVLFYAGRIHRITEVRDKGGGGATMDSRPDEQRRGITIKSAATRIEWDDHPINLIDTPGHIDFTIEVERSLRVLDGAVLVLCAVAGVQAQTGSVDRQMARYGVPCVAFINKMDLAGADPYRVLEQLRSKLRHNAALVTLPIGRERELAGVIDILRREAVYFDGEHGERVRRQPMPESMREQVDDHRQRLIEALAEVDESILARYVEGEPIDDESLARAARAATIGRHFTPVVCGSARGNVGIQPLLDAVVAYLPHPGQVRNTAFEIDSEQETETEIEIELRCTPDAPLRALAFKAVEDAYGGLTYLRIYQGQLSRGDTVFAGGRKLRAGRLVRLHADTISDIDHAEAGDIVALFGTACSTGDVLTSDGTQRISMRPMNVPKPVVSYAIVPKDRTMLDKFSRVLARLCREDPTLRVSYDDQSGQTILSGMGELHLEVYCDLLREQHGIELYRSPPLVTYRETIVAPVAFDHLHRKQDGGSGQYAKVVGQLRPTDQAYAFVDRVKGGAIAREFIGACDRGFRQAMECGPLLGSPVTGIEAVLEDGKTHSEDSSDLAFQIASRDAAKQALRRAQVAVLEPIMTVEVDAPSEFVGAVQSGLVRRRGQITDSEVGLSTVRVRARVPLAEMFGYAGDLRGTTEGKGEYSMEFADFQRVPASVQEQLVARHRGR